MTITPQWSSAGESNGITSMLSGVVAAAVVCESWPLRAGLSPVLWETLGRYLCSMGEALLLVGLRLGHQGPYGSLVSDCGPVQCECSQALVDTQRSRNGEQKVAQARMNRPTRTRRQRPGSSSVCVLRPEPLVCEQPPRCHHSLSILFLSRSQEMDVAVRDLRTHRGDSQF